MQRIGILGGLSPRSTARYYDIITSTHARRCPDLSSPEIVLFSMNFKKFVEWQSAGKWDEIKEVTVSALQTIAAAGADFALVAAGTVHHVFGALEDMSSIPLLSQIECVADEVARRGFRTVGLLGTAFTMRASFYQQTFERQGVRIMVPEPDEIVCIDDVIYRNLVKGVATESSRDAVRRAVEGLARKGAQAVIMGCTELPEAAPDESPVPLLDVTRIHAIAALDRATSGGAA
ncbi:MAG: amino acid racemase [Deltaproteobacteria bacterium]|nr:amino acid racemase [Deltaproteobacteria bacterium]